ncbi:thermonuclease family protein [Shewanella frigidimarina]|uniref:thermonuclease family protein n=1 Tax=Shewanella frigidimarina TaxID=56812 RepID=UPI003D7934E2
MQRYLFGVGLLITLLIVGFFKASFLAPSPQLPTSNTLVVTSIDSIYDGDTFFVNIVGIPDVFGKRIGIRLAGIDTPEIRGKCPSEKLLAIKARDHLQNLLLNGAAIELRNVTRGKYFRLVADVYIGSLNASDSLINEGLAVRYTGKEVKQGWCN